MSRAINVKDYGARGDVKTIFSRGSMNPDNNVLRLPGAGFTINDVPNTNKKIISISNVGVGGASLRTTIVGFNNSDEITLGSKSVAAGMGLTVTWGTNDTPAVQNAIDNAQAGDTIIFPLGVYCIRELRLRSGISIVSLEGSAKPIKVMEIPDSCIPETKLHRAILTQIIRDNSTLFIDSAKPGEVLKPLKDVTFQGLIFDGNIDKDKGNVGSELLNLGYVSGHSGIKFLNCDIRNFGRGVFVHGLGYNYFEIKNCTFIRNTYPIHFFDTNTTNIKITNCKFIDCVESITVHNNEHKNNTCDQVQIEGCHFSGTFHDYPIHFGSIQQGVAATHVTVKGCVVVGPDKWWWEGGSADHIALYNVEHFSVTDNTSINGGDGGVVIERGRYGTVSGNICNGNFGPGIYVDNLNPCFIHINANVCINNCRRIKLKTTPDLESKRAMSPAGGIAISGQDILITNNQCCDSTVPSPFVPHHLA